jgi:hypothetical protein
MLVQVSSLTGMSKTAGGLWHSLAKCWCTRSIRVLSRIRAAMTRMGLTAPKGL